MARIKEWETEYSQTMLYGWARDGLTFEQIAENMGVSRGTLHRWRLISPTINAAITKGRTIVTYEVESALIESALKGNVAAQIFALKNLRPDLWSDNPQKKFFEDEESGVSKVIVEIKDMSIPADNRGVLPPAQRVPDLCG